jgi:membrane protein required for colicin V production
MAMPTFHIYDLIMLAILLWCGVYGAIKGMAWQVAALASLVVSGYVAGRFSERLAPYLSNEAPWNRLLAMCILYFATSMAIWMLFRVVKGWIDRVHLKDFDRQLGALLGLLKGVVWCVVITFFAVMLSEPARQKVLESRSGYYIALLTHRAATLLPADIQAALGKYLDEFNRRLDPHAVVASAFKGRGPHADFEPSESKLGQFANDEIHLVTAANGLPILRLRRFSCGSKFD